MSRHGTALFCLSFALLLAGCSTSENASDGGTDAGADAGADGGHEWNDHELVVMSFNVMCSFCTSDTGNDPWDERVPDFGDIIKRHNPDLIGLQELTYPVEVTQILGVAPGYKAVYAKNLPEAPVLGTTYPDATILYRSNRFDPVETGFFWLSPTPDTAWAGGWTSTGSLPRIVIWAKLRQISDGRVFYFVSTHFDNNQPNQPNSAELVLQRFDPWAAGYPLVFVGDFNSKPDSTAYATLATGIGGTGFHFQNAYDLAGGTYTIVTNKTPAPVYDPASRIDHIWSAGTASWAASGWKVDMSVYGPNNYYPSDHFPISCTLKW